MRLRPIALGFALPGFALLGLPSFGAAQAPAQVTGRVIAAQTGDPVGSAMIRLGLSPEYAISDPDGYFTLEVSDGDIPTLVVTAPGFSKRYEPIAALATAPQEIRLDPEPIELEGVEVEVRSTIRVRLDRRRNIVPWNYVLEGDLLTQAKEDNLWELVGDRHNFDFEGYTDFGCTRARIRGKVQAVQLYIDERPVRLDWLKQFRPDDFALVEVYSFGGGIHAYTQKYMDWMIENEGVPTPWDTLFRMCPPPEPEPGEIKRGRPVGRSQ
ncbi:MAG: hypothetical protein ACR2QM_08950 [Longimicrobiales bacterium]